ncbi:hypothetical protein RV04_GL000215 [Enterococcus hermanniensis]|uniref:ABC3 transporter permease C-terminal domain-containing protein n=1 Tax=Enterococcus hermanniensis TaxID=249189 RepID=A0A1L8TS13_9ENTE|nr:hypothetical protein RV04_GL000215 [Enterococcus hermanniensis]
MIWRGFKKQLSNYLVFFFSLIFAVMVYYSFTAMTYEQPLIRSAGKNTQLVAMLGLGGFVVVLILLFFMTNTNRFFIENRRKDISIFHLYGLSYYQICLWFILEILFIGIFSFVIGISLGVLLSKLFSMILVKAMDLPLQVHFFFSTDAIVSTSLVVAFILLVVSLQVLWLVSRYKFSQLKKIQLRKIKAMTLSTSQKILAVIGVLLLAIGWGLAVFYLYFSRQWSDRFGLFQGNFLLMLLIFMICVVGSYLFFADTLRWYNAYRPKRLTKNLRILSRSEWQLRLSSEWRFLGSITVALGLALTLLGLMIAISSLVMRSVHESTPASLIVTSESFKKIEPELKAGFPYTKATVTLKAVPAKQDVRISGEETMTQPEVMDMVSLTDYRAFQKMNDTLGNIQLKATDATIILSSYQRFLNEYTQYDKVINLKQRKLFVQEMRPNFFGDTSMRYGTGMIVVSDKVFAETQGVAYKIEVIDVARRDENALNRIVKKNLKGDWDHPIHHDLSWKNGQIVGEIKTGDDTENKESTIYRSEYASHLETYRQARSTQGLILFVVTFVTTMFIIATASMLMMRQLSDFKQKRKQYLLLQQLGIPEKNIHQEINRENRYAFFIPALLALVHSILAISVIAHIAQNANYGFVYLFCGLMLAVYGLFYWITCMYQKKFL